MDGAIDKLMHEKSATIERCAQVVDALAKKANRGAIAALEEAAAEIRKLKDEGYEPVRTISTGGKILV